MALLSDIYALLEKKSPQALAQPWDNVGLLVRSNIRQITRVLVTLDITREVIAEAKKLNCELIVSHHPVIFSGIKTLSDENLAAVLFKNDISAICMHTNLDACEGGVNDILADILEMQDREIFAEGCGRIGKIKPTTTEQLANFCETKLGKGVRFSMSNKNIERLAIVSGAGGSYFEEACTLHADALLTGEASHHHALDAQNLGLALIACGHHATEMPIAKVLAKEIKTAFPTLETFVSTADKDPFSYTY